MAFPGSSNLTAIVVEGIGGVVESAPSLLQILQDNPVAVVVTTVAVVAVAVVGRAVLPCGQAAQAKPKVEEATRELPKPEAKPKKAPTLAIADLWGVYQPISVLLAKDAVTTAKHSTYKSGYKSADDKGRVFNFHAAPIDPGTMDWTKQPTWDALKKRNTQEFIAIAEVKEGDALPAAVTWSWKPVDKLRGSRDCDNPSPGLRFAAVDGKALTGDGSNGSCTAPVWDKTITLEGKATALHISAVKVLCPNVGGDGFQIRATFPQDEFERCGGSGAPPSDATGTIRIWKRIDVEYLYMQGASLPIDSVPKYYEPAFVQVDVTAGKEFGRVDVLAKSYATAGPKMDEIANAEGTYKKRMGWFLLFACYSAYTPPADAGDEVHRYAASHCSIKVWDGGSLADQDLVQVQNNEFAVGSKKTKAYYKKYGQLRGVILETPPPNVKPDKLRLFKNKATEVEDENYVDFRVASMHAYPEVDNRSVMIVEPEDYCTDFQPNSWSKNAKLLLQYPKDTVVVNYSESVTWLGKGGFSYPNAFSAKFVYTEARNLRGRSQSRE
jgi:hypothetical protein